MTARSRRYPLALVVLLASCGGDGDGSSIDCDSVPACYTEALDDLTACATSATLVMGSWEDTSGVVSGLECTDGDLVVSFSDFATSSDDSVSEPSIIIFTVAGETCAELHGGSGGTRTDEGDLVDRFDTFIIERPDAPNVKVTHFEDGRREIVCGSLGEAREEFSVRGGALDSCPDAVQVHVASRDEDLSMIAVDLRNANDELSTLFSCE